MAKPNTLLFLYMVPHTGHQKAAEAIMEAASHMNPRVNCAGVDAASHAYPLLSNMVNRVYLQMLKQAPGIWDYLYDNPDVEAATRDARKLLTFVSSFRIKALLKKHRPIAAICTQAAPAVALAAERRRGHLKIPFVCVVTDFGVHQYWLHPEVDLYLVAHEDVKNELIDRGIEPNKIRCTGIPIRPAFGESYDQIEERIRLRIHPNKKTILLMGGSRGLGSLDDLVEALKTIPLNFQTLVICGQNKTLHKKILKSTRGHDDFHVLSYTRDLPRLMAASDILITKPGGLTCSEALAMQLPMVLTNPIPGQEERNVRFLTRHNVALLARTPEELIVSVSNLLRRPKKLMNLKQRSRLIAKPHSAWESSRFIFDLIHNR